MSSRHGAPELCGASIRLLTARSLRPQEQRYSEYTLLEGRFQSPFSRHCPDLLPEVAEQAHFQAVLPNEWPTRLRPTVIHLAGTGDHVSQPRSGIVTEGGKSSK